MKDNFSNQASQYSQFRPHYPQELIDHVLSFVQNKDTALDVATGNGQVAIALSKHFHTVYATDISENQLLHAPKVLNVVYKKQSAEATDFDDKQFDLITVAQAVHWFDFNKFYAEVNRILKPNGIIHLKTDSPFLYTYTQAMVKENNYLILVDTSDLYGEEAIRRLGEETSEARALQTHYEHQWLDRGLTIKYIAWELPAAPSLIEPDIEIEKDTYRSYGRNYVSSTNN